MGRVKRTRKRNRNGTKKNQVTINSRIEYIELIKWMKEHDWKTTCKLVSAYFENTGRGLMAKENIFAGSAIAKIPYDLLITVKTVTNSQINYLFTDGLFLTQQVLSSFLIWEHHLGESSKWKNYINCLPQTFSCPVFCDDVSWLPAYLAERVEEIKTTIMKSYNGMLEYISSKICHHCGTALSCVFSYNQFLWAWCVVSTRAVYLCPTFNSQKSIKLSDENNLALAPYIDLFNHHCNAEVKAYVVESEGVYQIETLRPYSKNEEIFINYGPLSNDRLFIDYGFIIPCNIQDTISVTYEEIRQAVEKVTPSNKQINQYRCRFLQDRKMFNNMSCYAAGLSWDCQALIYVFTCSPEMKIEEIKQNIFSNKFKDYSGDEIRRTSEIIVKAKCEEYERELKLLDDRGEIAQLYAECYSAAHALLSECVQLLNRCQLSLTAKNSD